MNNSKKLAFDTTMNIMNMLYYGSIVLLILVSVLSIYMFSLPNTNFTAEAGLRSWEFTANLTENFSIGTYPPFTIIQKLPTFLFEAKSAFLTVFITNMFLTLSAYIFAIKQIRDILMSTILDGNPFAVVNSSRLRKVGWVIILYSLFSKLLLNILTIFVTGVFLVNLSNIKLSGIVIGVLVLCLSKIFQYGSVLQEEHDTTL